MARKLRFENQFPQKAIPNVSLNTYNMKVYCYEELFDPMGMSKIAETLSILGCHTTRMVKPWSCH